MKIVAIILQVTLLYAFNLLGDWISKALNLPISGSIIGMFLLFAALILKICPLRWIESGTLFIQAYMPLVFIPGMVSVINYFGLFAGKGVLLIILTILSTLITMIISGYTSQFMALQIEKRKEIKKCRTS